jgi:ribonuclease HI
MVIEASRWAVLQTEATPDSIITHWTTLWKQLSEWERLGGRTLHWAISTACKQHYQLDVLMGTYSLAADPSFKSFIPGGQEIPNDSRVLLQLYECQEQEDPLSWLRKLSKSTKWVAIIHTRQWQGQLKRVFARTAKCVARLDKGASVCLRKGWWKSGERRTTRAKVPYEIWCCNSIGTEDSFTLPGQLRWTPEPADDNPRIQAYLNALPGSQYNNKGIAVVATDGAYRRAKDGNVMSPMGAGVAWQHDHYPPKAVKVGGPTASSTRAELAAILLALRQANPAEALILLVDSTAAIRRLARFRSQEFRPAWETCKDADIVRDILDQLLLRTEHQGTTTFVLVHGHSSHPLHERADALAVQGAAESEEEFDDGTPNGLRMTKTGERWIAWGKQAQRHIQSHFAACAWEDRKQGTYMEQFLAQENAARTQLGCALKTSWDWAVRCWILCLTPGLLLACTKSRSKRTTTPQRCGCSEQGIETLSHIQLSCPLPWRHAARCSAHNAIVQVFEEVCGNTKSAHRSCVWDKTLSTLLTTLDRDLLMQATFNVTETIQDIHAWNAAIRSKRAPNPAALAKIGRRRELDTVRALISKEVINQRPDGIVVDANLRRIYVIEVARTEDSTDQLRRVFVRKNTKYIQFMHQLRALFPDFRTEQLTFVIGICGTIDEHLWRRQLTTLGLTTPKQNHLIQNCMKATIEGTHAVWRAGLKIQ